MERELKNDLGDVYFQAEYDQESEAVIAHWIGFATTEQLKEGMEAGLSLMKEKQSNKWIANAQLMEGGFEEANDWLEQDWTPRAVAAGLQKVAFVVSQDAFNEFSTNEYAERNEDLDNPHFPSLEEAKAWMKTN